MDKKTVLIVDDEPLLLHSLRLCLKNEFHVFIATSGTDALKLINRLHIDCLVTDMKMPGMNGLELLEKVRSDGYKMHVIVSSGYINEVEESKFNKLNINHYLQKPYSPITLIELLKSY
jgi:YesN/AraC family two-component response regulator